MQKLEVRLRKLHQTSIYDLFIWTYEKKCFLHPVYGRFIHYTLLLEEHLVEQGWWLPHHPNVLQEGSGFRGNAVMETFDTVPCIKLYILFILYM